MRIHIEYCCLVLQIKMCMVGSLLVQRDCLLHSSYSGLAQIWKVDLWSVAVRSFCADATTSHDWRNYVCVTRLYKANPEPASHLISLYPYHTHPALHLLPLCLLPLLNLPQSLPSLLQLRERARQRLASRHRPRRLQPSRPLSRRIPHGRRLSQ